MENGSISVITPEKYNPSHSTNSNMQTNIQTSSCIINPLIKQMRAVNHAAYAILLV